MANLLFEQDTFAIRGAVFEVYREMGCGFLESVYQECLEKEFHLRGIPFSTQRQLHVNYKSFRLDQTYKPDFLCYDKIIVELKAVKKISPEHQAQVLNYIKAAGISLGLLVNFGNFPKATIQRIIL